jgi:formate hydrogenlyase transcriptional activator
MRIHELKSPFGKDPWRRANSGSLLPHSSRNYFSAERHKMLYPLCYREIATLRDKLTKEKLYLEEEIRDVLHLEEIVGQSQSIKRALEQVKTVAPSNATTLITGETGTGKELIARAIHCLSSRHEGNFVKLNCAAIPSGLLESELFGHEKGAFTGAVSQKIGRLELADRGTVFLDEIGEIPLEIQPKLLRVLQDQEFERLGALVLFV